MGVFVERTIRIVLRDDLNDATQIRNRNRYFTRARRSVAELSVLIFAKTHHVSFVRDKTHVRLSDGNVRRVPDAIDENRRRLFATGDQAPTCNATIVGQSATLLSARFDFARRRQVFYMNGFFPVFKRSVSELAKGVVSKTVRAFFFAQEARVIL